jgi:hypothetical protein
MANTKVVNRKEVPVRLRRIGMRWKRRRARDGAPIGRRGVPFEGTIAQSWQAAGGQLWLGQLLPGLIVAAGLVLVAGSVAAALRGDGPGPSSFLGAFALMTGWLAWKVVRTVWLVSRSTADEIICRSSSREWRLGPGEIVAVKSDAYRLFLVMVTTETKIWLWAQMGDRPALLDAIRRCSPNVEVDDYAEAACR